MFTEIAIDMYLSFYKHIFIFPIVAEKEARDESFSIFALGSAPVDLQRTAILLGP